MFRTAIAILALSLGGSSQSLADQKLPADQQAKVEALLTSEGFTKWKEIELDDGVIEVDDAIDANGKQFDLKLDPQSLAITGRHEEKAKE